MGDYLPGQMHKPHRQMFVTKGHIFNDSLLNCSAAQSDLSFELLFFNCIALVVTCPLVGWAKEA